MGHTCGICLGKHRIESQSTVGYDGINLAWLARKVKLLSSKALEVRVTCHGHGGGDIDRDVKDGRGHFAAACGK